MVTLKGLSTGYSSRILTRDLDLTFDAGTLTAVVGRNGSGKSTLLRVIAGLSKPLAGEVFVSGTNIATLSPAELARAIGFVSTERPRPANLRVRDLVALGRTPHTDWTGRLTSVDRVAVDEALRLVCMSDFASKQSATLSDGELQKVMIARVLAQDTPVILLDEPTAFLDFYARRQVCELLARLVGECGKTVIFSSHELELVDEFADGRLEIDSGSATFTPL